MDRKVVWFLGVFLPLWLGLAAATMTRVNPISFPSVTANTTGILPLVGVVVLLIGVGIGWLGLCLVGEQEVAKRFAAAGLIGTVVATLLICNLCREGVLAAIAERGGRQAARRQAMSDDAYKPPDPRIKRQFPHLVHFLRKADESTVQSAFCGAYLRTFQSEFAETVDWDRLKQEAQEDGFGNGRASGRNAGFRGDPPNPPPVPERLLKRLQVTRMPEYLQAYEAGWREGWLAGHRERAGPNVH